MEGVANASTWLQGEADLLGHCFERFECVCFLGIGFRNVLCQVDKICPPLPLAERHTGMSKAERRVLGRVCKIHSQAARLGSLCPSTVSQATSSHCAAQLPSLPARTMPSASVSGSQVAWLCLVTPVGRLPEGGTSCEGSGRSREGLI